VWSNPKASPGSVARCDHFGHHHYGLHGGRSGCPVRGVAVHPAMRAHHVARPGQAGGAMRPRHRAGRGAGGGLEDSLKNGPLPLAATVRRMRPTFTVIACHIGDVFWVGEMARRLDEWSPPERVPEIVVVDQDRPTAHRPLLAALPRVSRVMAFPKDDDQFTWLSHDHPASLDRACREPMTTSHVLVMDSDTFVIDGWLEELDRALERADCVVAGDRKWGLSHPCFMALPVAALERVWFSAGAVPLGIDTGRLVAYQLDRAGLSVEVLRPVRAFQGRRGDLFLGGKVLHVGSASFASSTDQRALSQVDAVLDRIVQRRLERGEVELSAAELLLLRARAARRFVTRSRR
jgi:hypothetical protein